MNRIAKNFKLLIDDLDNISLINPFKKQIDPIKLLDERNEALLLYRHLLKNVPKLHGPSLLEQKYAYEVCKS
jgi:hypothetical protein